MNFQIKNLFVAAAALLLATACTYTLKINDGRTAYQQKQFANALPMLEREFAKAKLRSEKGKIAFLIADSYARTGRTDLSESWFKIAYDNNFGPEALRGLAFAQKKQQKYSDAREAFKNLGIEIGSPYEYRKEITACNIAEDWLKQTDGNGWHIETAPFNSAQNDFAPTYFAENQLVFTSDRTLAAGNDAAVYGWTGHKFMDLLVVAEDNASPQRFDPALNSAGNEGTAVFSRKMDEVFFVRAAGAYKYDDAFCKIYFSKKAEGASWDVPQPLPFQKEKINYLHPALAADGNTLIFAANDPEGWGGFDLYAVQRTSATENGWGEPRLLSRALNTSGNELFPTFDGDTLYFSSDGLTGMGGLDIFKTYRFDKTSWAPPINLKSPVNSGADDFSFIVDARSRRAKNAPAAQPDDLLVAGFFTSNRSGGRGGDDIYRFESRQPKPKPIPPPVERPPSLAHRMLLEGFVLEKIYAVPGDPNSQVLGRKPLAGATVQFEVLGKKQSIVVGEEGLFKVDLAENTDYFFNASRAEYLSNSAKFSTRGIAADKTVAVQTYEVEIVLDKIFKDKEIVLENIYYDYDKWDIRPDAEPTLNQLADVLRQNGQIRIQLGSHTDCRGNDGYNRQLSQRRAQSAVNYLISKGISAERLTAVGYGEEQAAAECICSRCSESEHQTNRRTTFKIVE